MHKGESMKRPVIMAIIIGSIFTLIVFIIWQASSRGEDDLVTVITSVNHIPAWHKIEDTDIKTAQIEASSYKNAYYNTAKSVIGKAPIVNIPAGEKITSAMLGENQPVSNSLPQGTYAYPLLLDNRRVRSPMAITPGDRIDVLAAISNQSISEDVIVTIAQNLLAIRVEFRAPTDAGSKPEPVKRGGILTNRNSKRNSVSERALSPQSIILAVTADQAQDLELAKQNGILTLLVRSSGYTMEDFEEPPRTLSGFLKSKGVPIERNDNARTVTPSVEIKPKSIMIISGTQVERVPLSK